MAAAPRHTRQAQGGSGQQSRTDSTSQKKAGRPKGPPSTIVNLRIPLDLLAQLDRYIVSGCKFSREPPLLSLALVEGQNKGRVWCRQKNVR
jgi:hypothetical protein